MGPNDRSPDPGDDQAATGPRAGTRTEPNPSLRPGPGPGRPGAPRRPDRAGVAGRERAAFSALLALSSALVLVAGLLFSLDRPRPGAAPGARPAAPTAAPPAGTAPGGSATTAAPTPAPAPRRSIRDVDLANATYPTAACAHYRLPGDTFTLVDGTAGSPPDLIGLPSPPDPRGVQLGSVTYGDVTGDGAEDAAVVLTCYKPNSDALTRGVAVVAMTGAGPTTVATLPTSGVPAIGRFLVIDDDRSPIRLEPRPLHYDLAEQVDIIDGRLVVRWRQSALGGDALGDGYDVTATYRIGPGGATLTGEPTRVTLPYQGEPRPDTLAAHAVRTADLGSLTLPLAAAGRDAADRVCPTVFDPLGAARDATLARGAAVVDGDGRPLGASVRIDDVRFGSVDPDAYEDALVLVRCDTAEATMRAAVLVRWVDGAPVLHQALGAPSLEGLTTVDARVGRPGQVLLSVERAIGHGSDPSTRTTVTLDWSSTTGRL